MTNIFQKQEAEENELFAAGLMVLPPNEKRDDLLNVPSPQVKMSVTQKVIREERDED